MLGLKKLISTSYASASKKIEYHQITLFEMNSPQYDEKRQIHMERFLFWKRIVMLLEELI